MREVLELLAAPVAASLVLTGILTYFGLHVVERGVIFVDLAIAQVAALGATFAVFFGLSLHGGAAYACSLGLSFGAAILFSSVRGEKFRIPQEAIIGITYAVCAAASIVVMSQSPEGGEHLKDMLVGNILTVGWGTVGKTAALYLAIGILHWAFRRPLLEISQDSAAAARAGRRIWAWDLFFYGTFGLVVTSGVAIAGVLLVFSYLIVPSVTAMLFTRRLGPRLAIGWAMGTLVSALGMASSYRLDLPTGATIVVTFGVVLTLTALAYWVWNKLVGREAVA
ncbi:MAG: metal ABC transporter permease [Elusimicrobiota bacterium]|jgi:zinc/manganese transport system permease protein